MSKALVDLYNISRKITTNENKYMYIASRYGLQNYRVISSGELNIRGKDIELPTYVREFVKGQGEVVVINNMYKNNVEGIIMRGIKEKAFTVCGFKKGSLYGLGSLDKDFKYGDLIVLVEGAIDSDVCRLFLTKNCLAVMTSSITKSQLQVLSCLTDKVLLLLDNDEAGNKGEESSKKKLESAGILTYRISKDYRIKDLGDLLDMKRNGDTYADYIINYYKAQILGKGGKIV